ncbi:hypothetical protein V8C86DRAFT_3025352 [Haematococcus lacustris]
MWAQTSPSVIIPDGFGTALTFPFALTALDDASSLTQHISLINSQVASGGGDFIMNVQPSFAVQESQTVDRLGRINMHSITGNDAVFARQLPSVFGVAPSSSRATSELFVQYRGDGIQKIAFAYRSDIPELEATCTAAMNNAAVQLLVVAASVPYSASDPDTLAAVAAAIASVPGLEVFMACSLTSDALQLAQQLDRLRKPLKSIVFTNGPQKANFSSALGAISRYVTAPASWAADVPGTLDSTYGGARDYANKFAVAFNTDATAAAAASTATGMALQAALQTAFLKCNISAARGNVAALLYSNNVISCSDNQNNGRQRVLDTLQLLSISTFFGNVAFNRFRQNYAGVTRILQVLPSVQDSRPVNLPATVLPVTEAQKALVVPQPNRYAPICQPGTFRGADDFLPCTLCQPGQFQDQEGARQCESCPRNFYSNASAASHCVPCPAQSETMVRGAKSVSECLCQAGTFTPLGVPGSECFRCPENADCAGGVDPPRARPGWYEEPNKPWVVYNCNPNYVCAGNFSCAEGHRGRMCAYCEEGYYYAFSRCLKCSSSGTNLVAMLLIYVLFVIINTSVTKNLEVFHVVTNSASNVGCSSCHVLTMLASLEGPTQKGLNAYCLKPDWSFEENLYVQLSMPVFMFLAIGMVKLRIRGKTLSDFNVDASVKGGSTASSAKGGVSSGSFSTQQLAAWWVLLQSAGAQWVHVATVAGAAH